MGLWNLSESQFHRKLAPAEGKAIIRSGYRKGIRMFDTAYSYGDAEAILSSAMREIGIDDYRVISKVMPVPTMRRKAEATLRRLGRDYADILLIHWPAEEESLYSSMKELERLKEEGKALSIGVSNFPPGLLRKAMQDFPITFHERPLSLIWTKGWEEERHLDIRTLAYAPLGMGVLSGRYAGDDARNGLASLSSPYIGKLMTELGGDAAMALSWVYGEKPYGIISGFSSIPDLSILDRIKEIPEDKRKRLTELAQLIDSTTDADNIFAHDWNRK